MNRFKMYACSIVAPTTTMFSKPLRNFFVSSPVEEEEDDALTPQGVVEENKPRLPITPDEFFAEPDCLDAMKSVELRRILKHYKSIMNFKSGRVYTSPEFQFLKERFKVLYDFALLGNKDKILERIRNHFDQHRFATRIQKRVRGHFVRLSVKLRGPALRDRSMCVNNSDGCTLEPLQEIPFQNFFSYRDVDGFVYGFEVDSLIHMISSSCTCIGPLRCINPFNRARMDSILPQIKILIRLTCMSQGMSYPHFVVLSKPLYVPRHRLPTRPSSSSSSASAAATESAANLPNEYNMEIMIHRMRDMRLRSFPDRAAALFMEIDQLGHYTQSTWFTSLDNTQMTRYLRYLQDFWMYRAHLSPEIKLRICPLWDPFISLLRGSVNIYDLSSDHIRTICLGVMEDMIFTGVDTESRILGSFQVLTCLTLVSVPARHSMMYLYESVSY